MWASTQPSGEVTVFVETLWPRRPDGTDLDGDPFETVTWLDVYTSGMTRIGGLALNFNQTILKQTFATHHVRRQIITFDMAANGLSPGSDYVLFWEHCCRPAGVANAPPTPLSLMCSIRLDPTRVTSSPQLNGSLISTVFKTGTPPQTTGFTQNLGASDPDQPLTYQLLTGANAPSYAPAYLIGQPNSQGYDPQDNSCGGTCPISPSPFLDTSFQISLDSVGQLSIPAKTIPFLQDTNPNEASVLYTDFADYVVSIRVSDATGLFSDIDLLLDVARTANLPPHTPQVIGSPLGEIGQPFSLSVNAGDPDPADTVTLTVAGLPSFLSFVPTPGNPATGTILGTPSAPGDVGTHSITLNAIDDGLPNLAASSTLTLTVAEGSSQPLLYDRLDGATLGTAQGGSFPPSGSNGFFDMDRGFAPGAAGRLDYSTAGALDPDAGTVAMWVRLNALSPFRQHYLFHTSSGFSNQIGLYIETLNGFQRVYAFMTTHGSLLGIADFTMFTHVNWNAGDWHHIAFSYGPAEPHLYVDGVEVSYLNPPGWRDGVVVGLPFLPATMQLGSRFDGAFPADATIDELLIYGSQRSAAELALAARGPGLLFDNGPVSGPQYGRFLDAPDASSTRWSWPRVP